MKKTASKIVAIVLALSLAACATGRAVGGSRPVSKPQTELDRDLTPGGQRL